MYLNLDLNCIISPCNGLPQWTEAQASKLLRPNRTRWHKLGQTRLYQSSWSVDLVRLCEYHIHKVEKEKEKEKFTVC